MENQTDELYLPKEQAAQRLELSVRRVMELVKEKKIRRKRVVDPRTGRKASVLLAADVARLRERRPAAIEDGGAVAVIDPQPPVPQRQVALLGEAAALPPHPLPWFTLDEAAEHTGLSAQDLEDMILAGELAARRVRARHGVHGRWRVHRSDFESLRGVQYPVVKTAQAKSAVV